jgi:hypothetical protein
MAVFEVDFAEQKRGAERPFLIRSAPVDQFDASAGVTSSAGTFTALSIRRLPATISTTLLCARRFFPVIACV